MSTHDLSPWLHEHRFDAGSAAAERGTLAVLVITLLMMVTEIVAGWWWHSMALLADGWHMSSHALAIGLAAFSYRAARRQAQDSRYAFGTWKIEILGSFASALLLLGVALVMLIESAARMAEPLPIRYPEAMSVAALGLVVNVVCALILGRAHHHGHGEHDHGHGHHHSHDDLNLRSAYVHVLADAATSILAIVALAGAWTWGWVWLDPLMGILGAVLIAVWARRLLADSGTVLLDREMDHPVVQEIREVIDGIDAEEGGGETHLADLHVWRVGRRAYACVMTLVTHDPSLTAARVRERLAIHAEIVHSTIEIHRCTH